LCWIPLLAEDIQAKTAIVVDIAMVNLGAQIHLDMQ
jgi:hypothetical protein